MKYIRKFESAAALQAALATLERPFVAWDSTASTTNLEFGELTEAPTTEAPTIVYDHYIGTINAEEEGDFEILTAKSSGEGFALTPSRVVVDGVELTEVLGDIHLTEGLHTIEIWDDPNSEGYYTMCNVDDGYFASCDYTSMIIPDYVTSIGNYAFRDCNRLTSFTIPDAVTSIGGSAFAYCSGLTSFVIPDSVTNIGIQAFYDCSRLTSITCNAINPPTIGDDAFSETHECPIYVPASSVDTYKAATGWSYYADRIQPIQ